MSRRKHLILGTAGHIDHGKTALVRALTGIDCDTHPEEKARGITIHLGFAHFRLPSGERIGVVDVPGHAAFIRTMVAGASGIDIALLVVAADEGVMPQTREHIEILGILGVKHGIIALSKCDLVDSESCAMAAEEIREAVAGTLFDGAPVIPVSAKTGEGLERLRHELSHLVATLPDRPLGEVFRMFVDRIFTVKGFGCVVTGSVLSGRLSRDSTAWLLPPAKELRVRRVEQFGEEVPDVVAGDRASLNLVGLTPSDFQRGMLIADRPLRATTLADVTLRLFPHARAIGLWSQVSFHVGTYEAQARVHLLDCDRLNPGQSAIAQIHLPTPCILQAGDRFVIRSSSSDTTLGGGEIIDPFPLHHRKRRPELIALLSRLANGKRAELIAAEIRKHSAPLSCSTLGDMLNLSEQEVRNIVRKEMEQDIVTYEINGQLIVHRRDMSVLWAERALTAIAAHHRRNPLDTRGLRVREIGGAVGAPQDTISESVLAVLLDRMVTEGKLKRVEDTYALREHSVVITPELKRRISFVSDYLASHGMKVPIYAEMVAAAARQGFDEKELHRILRYLVASRRAYHIGDAYLDAGIVDKCRQQLVTELKRRPGGMTVAEFRDLVSGNRKICLLMLAQFDAEGTTVRRGDVRVLAD